MNKTSKKLSGSEKTRAQQASDSLRGWPGYRTREGRSGLDPVDSPAEEGHMVGVFVHNLLTGRLHTKNPFYLLLLAILGIIFVLPFILAIFEAVRGDLLPLGAWAVVTLTGLLGLAFLVNFVKNLLHPWGK
jgi:hypothetical protein